MGSMSAQCWVTLIVGVGAILGVVITWQQKNHVDRRSAWWERATWAFERIFSSDAVEAELGWKMIAQLVKSRQATKDDCDIVQVFAEQCDKRFENLPDADVEIPELAYLPAHSPFVRKAAAEAAMAASLRTERKVNLRLRDLALGADPAV
jgi:hypothetical protein